MSGFNVKVVTLNISAHPNADKLELANPVGTGWQCVTGLGTYKTGDLAVYLPVDSVLPPEMVKKLDIEKYYSKRLKTIRLRGSISQGMVIPLSLLKDAWHDKNPSVSRDSFSKPISYLKIEAPEPGDDVTELLGISKYDPPIPVEMAGIQRKADSRFIKYTQIENAKNFPEVFKEGDHVVITEKIHGTNFRSANIEGEIHTGSHNCNLIESKSNVYWRAANLLGVKEKLLPGEQIFGEVFGRGVQDLTYSQKDITVQIFDVFKDNRYLSHPELVHFLLTKGWDDKIVPVLYMGEWKPELVSLASGNSTIDPNQIKEGMVVKPMMESFDQSLQGRKVLKVISDEYLVRRDATERH